MVNFCAAARPFYLENNREKKEFNANSREGELSMPRCTQKYMLTHQAMVPRAAGLDRRDRARAVRSTGTRYAVPAQRWFDLRHHVVNNYYVKVLLQGLTL